MRARRRQAIEGARRRRTRREEMSAGMLHAAGRRVGRRKGRYATGMAYECSRVTRALSVETCSGYALLYEVDGAVRNIGEKERTRYTREIAAYQQHGTPILVLAPDGCQARRAAVMEFSRRFTRRLPARLAGICRLAGSASRPVLHTREARRHGDMPWRRLCAMAERRRVTQNIV